jgi:hypothetical protein
MFKKIGRVISLVVFLSLIAISQFSFIAVLPPFWQQLNLVLITLIFILFFFDFPTALTAALVGGFWLDIFAFDFFGFQLLALSLTLILAQWIATAWLTNRSFYSFLLLMLASAVVYNLITGFLRYFFTAEAGVFFLASGAFWRALLYQAGGNFLSALLLFNVVGAVTRRLQPFFLGKEYLEKK